MRMDRYEDENKKTDEKTTRLNKNQDLYADVYLNNVYVDIDKLNDVMNDDLDNKLEVKKQKEVNLSEYSTYEEKEYDIVKLVEEAIKNKDEVPNQNYDFESKEEEIKNVIESINEKALEEEKAHEDDELMSDLMPTSENTDILPALEPLPDTTDVIGHLSAPITDTSILELPDDTTTKVSLDMLTEIGDDDMESDDSFTEEKSHKYIKIIVILIVILMIGAAILLLKLLNVI